MDQKREAEQVDGTWFTYFNKIVPTIFTDEVCNRYVQSLEQIYGDFFGRNLRPASGPLISLGAGFGMTEIPLARKGYTVIGIDNDRQVLELLRTNAVNYGMNRVTAKFGDLYTDFHQEFVGTGIQACISFGTLEHFSKLIPVSC